MISGIPWQIWLAGAVFALLVCGFVVGCIVDSVRPPTVNEDALNDAYRRRLRGEASYRS